MRTLMRKFKEIHHNPFPHLLNEDTFLSSPSTNLKSLTKYQRYIIHNMKRGAEILLDISRKQALLYTVKNGIKKLCKISIRTLSSLIRNGIIHINNREGNRVFFVIND